MVVTCSAWRQHIVAHSGSSTHILFLPTLGISTLQKLWGRLQVSIFADSMDDSGTSCCGSALPWSEKVASVSFSTRSLSTRSLRDQSPSARCQCLLWGSGLSLFPLRPEVSLRKGGLDPWLPAWWHIVNTKKTEKKQSLSPRLAPWNWNTVLEGRASGSTD